MGCSHEACHCAEATITRDEMTFCSEACADAFESEGEDSCPCEHPDCQGTSA